MTDGETLRRTLISKSDEIDSKQRENEQLKVKNTDLESIIKSLQDANGLLKRLNDENEMNKHELKKKQDDYEQFQKVCSTIAFLYLTFYFIFSRCMM